MSLCCTTLEQSYPLENGDEFYRAKLYFTVSFMQNNEDPLFRLDNHPVGRSCKKEGCIHIPLSMFEMRFFQTHKPDGSIWHRGNMTASYDGCTLIMKMKRDRVGGAEIVEAHLSPQEQGSLRNVIKNVCEDIDMMSVYARRKNGDAKRRVVKDNSVLNRLALAHIQYMREQHYKRGVEHNYCFEYDDLDASTFKTFLHANGLAASRSFKLEEIIARVQDTDNEFARWCILPTAKLFIHKASCKSCMREMGT